MTEIEDLIRRIKVLENGGPYVMEGVFSSHYHRWEAAIADLYRMQPVPVRERAARLFRAVAERLARSA